MRSATNSRPCACCGRLLPSKVKRSLCGRLCFRVLTNERNRQRRRVRWVQERKARAGVREIAPCM